METTISSWRRCSDWCWRIAAALIPSMRPIFLWHKPFGNSISIRQHQADARYLCSSHSIYKYIHIPITHSIHSRNECRLDRLNNQHTPRVECVYINALQPCALFTCVWNRSQHISRNIRNSLVVIHTATFASRDICFNANCHTCDGKTQHNIHIFVSIWAYS